MNRPSPDVQNILRWVTKILLPLIQKSVGGATRAHLHSLPDGANSASFGYSCWSYLAELCKRAWLEGALPVDGLDPAGCVLWVFGHPLHFYRVGRSRRDNIKTSFPREGKFKVSGEHSQTLPIPFPDLSTGSDNKPFIVAFMADELEGLNQVHLCRIDSIDEDTGAITGWAETAVVWIRPDDESGSAEIGTGPTGPTDPVIIPEPKVVRIRKDANAAE